MKRYSNEIVRFCQIVQEFLADKDRQIVITIDENEDSYWLLNHVVTHDGIPSATLCCDNESEELQVQEFESLVEMTTWLMTTAFISDSYRIYLDSL